MTCYNCGSTIAAGSSQCSQCGQVIQVSEQGSSQNNIRCTLCNKENAMGTTFCSQCGTRLPQTEGQGQPVYQQSTAYSTPAPQFYPPAINKEPVVKLSQYLLWFFLMTIPIIGLICSIIFAVDSNNKNRSNFFRALLLFRLIAFVIGFIIGFLFMGVITNFVYEIFDYNSFDFYEFLHLVPAKLRLLISTLTIF